ncbi:MAG: hypothetical protein HYU71_08310 [Bacteroidetes bacterium]|nr:hypothetical protein [Bacteroidota bacterium]
MKLFILFYFILTVACLNAQSPVKGCPKIIYHSYQLMWEQCDSTIKKVGTTSFSNKLYIRYKDGSKQYVSEDSIWGIRRKNDYPVRIVDGYFYELVQLSPVYKYIKRVGKYTDYYFSATPDSPLYRYTQEQLQKQTDSATYYEIVKESKNNRHELSIDLYALNTSLLNTDFWGGGLTMKYYLSKKWGTGFSLAGAERKIPETFSFNIGIPTITYMEIGWLNQYDILQAKKLRVGINIINGLLFSELRDKSQTESIRTRYGRKNVSKLIATNYYYLLQPGIDVAYKLFSFRYEPDFYLTFKSGYRLVFGNSNYGSNKEFNGSVFAAGMSLIGFDKMQFSKRKTK